MNMEIKLETMHSLRKRWDMYKEYLKHFLSMKIDRIKVYLKCLLSGKNTFKGLLKLITTAIGYISSIYTCSVLTKDLLGINQLEQLYKNFWWILIIIGVIASLIHNHEKISCRGIYKNNDFQIEVKVDDLFALKGSSFVIPTNTYFRTIMEREYISPRSVQGAFQLKYFRKNIEKLDQLIATSLKQQGKIGEKCSDIHGIVYKYPIGTVAKVDHKGKHYYFVAINDVNEYGKPINQEYENINKALKGLLETINTSGHYDDLVMPLLGTGKAAINEATIEKVVENIVDTFLASNRKIARKLTICIRPRDYLEGRADLNIFNDYIDYKCRFHQNSPNAMDNAA